jgi:ribosomal protein L27
MTSVLMRGKKTAQVGSSKNKCGHPKGKKRGMKVYDGQRVPAGSVLCNQIRVQIFPGWNVRS